MRIYIVEDSAIVARALTKTLGLRHPDVEIIPVVGESGYAALQAFRDHSPTHRDAVIVDGLNGYWGEAVRFAQQTQATALVFTGETRKIEERLRQYGHLRPFRIFGKAQDEAELYAYIAELIKSFES